jgi:hypothetical protein
MKKPKQIKTNRSRRVSLITFAVVAVIVGATAIAVASRQGVSRKESTSAQPKSIVSDAGKKYVTVKVAGRDVQVDPQTGQIRPLSPEEAKQLADGLKTMLNKSTDGLVQVSHADGSVSMNLQGRFQNVTMARVNADGTLEQSCTDEPEAAAKFFGIDPQLLGVEPTKGAAAQPVVRTPAKKVSQ